MVSPVDPDGSRDGVALHEMPGQFAMEFISGVAGILLGLAWLGFFVWATGGWRPSTDALLAVPTTHIEVLIGCGIALLFFALTIVATFRGQAAVWDGERQLAQQWLAACSVLCVLGMMLMIWSSGGFISPFLTLYVMTHTLTLANVERSRGPWDVLMVFGVGMLLSVYSASLVPESQKELMFDIVSTRLPWLTFGGAALSLVVSTAGATWNKSRSNVLREWTRVVGSEAARTAPFAVRSRTKVLSAILRMHRLLNENNQSMGLVIGPQGQQLEVTLGNLSKPSDATMSFDSWRCFYRVMRRKRLLTLAQLYLEGKVQASGNLIAVARFADKKLDSHPPSETELALGRLVRAAIRLLHLERRYLNSLQHYGESPELYARFLDSYMQYTCALWEGEVSLDPPADADAAKREIDAAQRRKLQLIADSLQLSQGQRVLDVGCGWGGLCKFLFEERGVEAWGLTNSSSQAAYARSLVGTPHPKIVVKDYFEFTASQPFDAVTVVGMLEHVPVKSRKAFFRQAHDMLKPGGRMYLQCINASLEWTGGDGTRFLQKFVFPGYELQRLDEVRELANGAGFEIEWVRSENQHYGRTALLWLHRLMDQADEFTDSDGIRFYRLMTAYLAVAALVFYDGRGALDRLLLRRPEEPIHLTPRDAEHRPAQTSSASGQAS